MALEYGGARIGRRHRVVSHACTIFSMLVKRGIVNRPHTEL